MHNSDRRKGIKKMKIPLCDDCGEKMEMNYSKADIIEGTMHYVWFCVECDNEYFIDPEDQYF
jgi:hypothetical protein